uniref:Kazal-like domain-containing protein n=2 Tax=Haplochromini TaxID=319058 RepID=A0A3B4FIM3_9CICH
NFITQFQLLLSLKTSCLFHGSNQNISRTKPEPSCACQEKVPVCGSDGWTHPSICQLREAASSSNTTKNLSRRGPCYSS